MLSDKKLITVLQISAVLFVILVSIASAIVVFLDYRQIEDIKEQESQHTLYLTHHLTENFMSNMNYYSKLLLLTSQSVEKYLIADPPPETHIINLFDRILKLNPEIFQVRYLDETGMEKIRLESANSTISITPPEQLQDKNDRYYFNETISMNSGELFVSTIDLNMEKGLIQTPWIPTIRIATPVKTPDGINTGIMIINIDVTLLLEKFYSVDPGLTTYLINSDGYFLAGPDEQNLWGFMFGKDALFAQEHPDLWKMIESSDYGTFNTKEQIWSFKKIYWEPVLEECNCPTGQSWIIITKTQISDMVKTRGRYMPFIYTAGVVVLLAVSIVLGKIIAERRIAISERNSVETALIRAERMAALGRMVSGLAHELNTPIGSSVTLASNLIDITEKFATSISKGEIRRVDLEDYTRTAVETSGHLLDCLSRSSDLVSRLKEVSVDQASERKRKFTLPKYINDILATVRPMYKNKNVKILVEAREDVELDSYPGAFAQVITNLLNNSMKHGDLDEKGVIRIKVEKQRQFVMISVRDNGRGIPAENIGKIFDPFFSTAQDIGGSGLGLQIVYNIVKDMLKGTITVKSKVDNYAEFRIRLPLSI